MAPSITSASLATASSELEAPATVDEPALAVTSAPAEAPAANPTLSPTGIVPPPVPSTPPDSTATDTPRPRTARSARRGRRRGASPRRWQLAGLIFVLVIIIGAVAALVGGHRPPKSPANGASAQPGDQRLATAADIRSQAVGWVASQVGHDVTVACDYATCSALAARGFPASNLNVLAPTRPDPYGSVVVIATADIRSQFGTKLDNVYAPQVIASFGAGSARIDVRDIAPLGPAAFRTALAADLAARQSSGEELLRNPKIAVSSSARALMAAGVIDSRLLATIAFLAGQHPIDIVGFGAASPGGGAVPLRSVYLAESDAAAHMTGSAYVQSLESVVHAQSPPYVPLSVGTVHFGGGPPVLQVVFAAPSPLGLLHA